MTWDSNPLEYRDVVESENLPEITINVPHDRQRTLIIDENGVVSTKDSSSFLFILTKETESNLFLKLFDPS